MKRKTSDIPSRIYSFRVLSPKTEAARVEAQFRLASQYRNASVEIDHWLWEQLREAQLGHPMIAPALRLLEDAQAGVDHAYDEIRAAKSGTADPDLAGPLDRLATAKELRDAAIDDLREAKHPSKLLSAARKAAAQLTKAQAASEDSAKIADLEAAAIAAAEEAAAVSTAADEALLAAYDRAHEAEHVKHLAVRKGYIARGLCTGTYEKIDNAIKQAKKSTKGPLSFERYDGSGSIGAQLIGGLTVAELHSCADTRVRLQPLPDDYWQLPRNRRRHAARVRAWLRIGSNPNCTPIFAEFPVTFHRPLPKDAVIKWAYVVRHRVGRYLEWRLQLTVESETFRTPTQPVGENACAVNLGWRRIFDDAGNQIGLRAGYLVDEIGREREILVPDKLWRDPEECSRNLGKVYGLAGDRDRELDAARDVLTSYLHEIGDRAPAWLAEATKGLPQWRAPRKMQGLVDRWKRSHKDQPTIQSQEPNILITMDRKYARVRMDLVTCRREVMEILNGKEADLATIAQASGGRLRSMGRNPQIDRVPIASAPEVARQLRALWEGAAQEIQQARDERPPEDGAIVARLEAWAMQDRHLHRWQETQRDRLYAHRKETWRVIAAELANKYATIIVEETKYPEIDGWEQPEPEDGDPSEGRDQRRMSRLAAPGELRGAIVFSATKRGARTIVGETKRITQDCAWCGHEDDFDAAASITHRCGGCARMWDQDANACRNLLKREGFSSGEVPLSGDPVPARRKSSSSQEASGSVAQAALGKAR